MRGNAGDPAELRLSRSLRVIGAHALRDIPIGEKIDSGTDLFVELLIERVSRRRSPSRLALFELLEIVRLQPIQSQQSTWFLHRRDLEKWLTLQLILCL